VQRYGAVPPYRETVSYVKRVKNTYQTRKSHPNQRPDAATPSQNTPANAATGAPVASVTGTR
jgi:hypothetical protein